MKRAAVVRWVWLAAVLAACAEGRTVITVDVLSFLQAAGLDAIPFEIPGGVAQTDLTVARLFSMPSGYGSSRMDSLEVTAGAILKNTQGGGSVALDVFFAKDEAGLFVGEPFVSTHASVSGAQTDTLLAPTKRSVDAAVFSTPDVWVGVRARFATDSGPEMVGRLALTVLRLRAVMHQQIF